MTCKPDWIKHRQPSRSGHLALLRGHVSLYSGAVPDGPGEQDDQLSLATFDLTAWAGRKLAVERAHLPESSSIGKDLGTSRVKPRDVSSSAFAWIFAAVSTGTSKAAPCRPAKPSASDGSRDSACAHDQAHAHTHSKIGVAVRLLCTLVPALLRRQAWLLQHLMQLSRTLRG